MYFEFLLGLMSYPRKGRGLWTLLQHPTLTHLDLTLGKISFRPSVSPVIAPANLMCQYKVLSDRNKMCCRVVFDVKTTARRGRVATALAICCWCLSRWWFDFLNLQLAAVFCGCHGHSELQRRVGEVKTSWETVQVQTVQVSELTVALSQTAASTASVFEEKQTHISFLG